jgi:hypothetical protein
MKRAHFIAAVAGLVLLGCDRPVPTDSRIEGPSAAIADGFNDDDRSQFFFLFPIRRLHQQPPQTGFNPDLQPVVEVCEWTGTACVLPLVSRLTMTDPSVLNRIHVFPHFREYAVLWRTRHLALQENKIYRIRVLVGARELGFADVDVVRTLRQLIAVDEDEFVPLLKDFILPIRFWIGAGALCDPAAAFCGSATIALAEGGTVTIANTGDNVRIPAQPGDPRVVTVTLQYCDGIGVDLKVFGRCLQVTADPPLGRTALANRAVISICTLEIGDLGLTEAQERLVTMHREDGETITALPHAEEECFGGLGARDGPAAGFAAAGWRAVGRAVGAVFGVRPLYARALVLNLGGGGESEFFSDFQFALPAKMEALEGTLNQDGSAGNAVPNPPGVLVTDLDGQPVQGATVHFSLLDQVGAITPLTVVTGENGEARVTSWVLGELATQRARASGRGIADAETNGPRDGFDPFMPDIADPTGEQQPVPVHAGEVVFTATLGSGGVIGLASGLHFPRGMWIRGGFVYFTETAGRNTSFGGNVRLLRFNLATGGLEPLVNNPVNSDGVVVDDGGNVWLTSYHEATPGEVGAVSRARFDVDVGWVEDPIFDLEIASHDMFIDTDETMFVIGSSDQSNAASLYELNEESPVVLARGLGRAQGMTKVGTDIYFTRLAPGEIRRLRAGTNQLLLNEVQAVSLTSDGTFLYYAEQIDGRISRMQLTTGDTETFLSGLNNPTQVRFAGGRLFFLEGGTVEQEYKDGTLKYFELPTP